MEPYDVIVNQPVVIDNVSKFLLKNTLSKVISMTSPLDTSLPSCHVPL